ncbi:MAG: methyltransferase domain-containing protein [Acidobacteriota bacterium]
MERLVQESPTRWEPGRSSDVRTSPRRKTLARVRVFEGPALGDGAVATDLSAGGAFLRGSRPVRSASRGERLRLSLEIPTDARPIELAARIVRVTPDGVGVRFEEVPARDSARLRAHTGFYEMDEAIVLVQRALGGAFPGNLLPLGDRPEIGRILRSAVERGVPMTAVQPGRGFRTASCRLVAFEDGLLRLDLPLDAGHRVVYLAFADPPLHGAFEGILAEPGARPALLVPERIYLTEEDRGQNLERRQLTNGLVARLSRTVSSLGGRVAALVRRPDRRAEEVEVVRYSNRFGRTVAGIVDANFDTSDPDARPDAAVVIAPAILKRKEVFGLLARTIVDDLGRDGRKVAVLRFDASHIVGESAMDPRLVAEGRPYYHWTFGDLGADTEASLHYLEGRFRPAKRALVSVSLSAIPARKVVLGESAAPMAPVDLWIAPYGCPDAQDVLRNYLAGLDLFEEYRQGTGPETILIHGRPMRGASLYGQAMADGLAFLEDARRDLSRIQAPVVWILGTYDCWVTRSRVRAMLDAPGGGVREVFECATGHVLKTGAEAVGVFKLVSESISKHLFQRERPARGPDLARFARQSAAEWARVRRLELDDAGAFWKEHLLGAPEIPADTVGYDVLLEHPEYPRFLARQAELLDARPGEDLADLGCGTGNLTLAMLASCPPGAAPGSITFVDLVPEGVARTEEKVRAWFANRGMPVPACRGLVADLDAPPALAVLADASFDRIGCSLVLPYLRDPLAALREMRRLLRPGGALVVSSIRPDFDPSKLYMEGAEILSRAGDAESARKLEALRHYGNSVSRLLELEEDGRFRFFDAAALTALVSEAGFARAHALQAFGWPPTAVLVRAEA